MKYRVTPFLAGLLITAMATWSFGQSNSNYKPAFLLGLKADIQSAGIANQNNYGQNEMDYGVNFGGGGGVVLTYQMRPRSAMLLEASYQTSGQKYDDTFKFKHFVKDVQFSLLSIPLMYRYQFKEAPGGYSGVGTETKPIWYLQGGVQADKMLSPEIKWRVDGTETDFLQFVLEGGNPNQSIIESQGAPVSDEELFTQWSVSAVAAGGFILYLNSTMRFTLELRGGIGITDINAEQWRLKNNENVYAASRNSFLGLHAGIHFQLTQSQ